MTTSTYPTGLTPRYGGEKIAFRPTTTDNQADRGTIDGISKVIETYRADKRATKLKIEYEKENKIKDIDKENDPELARLSTKITDAIKGSASGAEIAQLEADRAKQAEIKIKASKDVLKEYHQAVQQDAGWRWAELKSRITAVNGVASVDEATTPSGGMAFVRNAQGVVLYTILFEESRFNLRPDMPGGNVYTKIGSPADSPRKTYVRDSNGVMTRRHVTRAVLVYNLATMFGLSITPPDGKVRDEDKELPEHLRRRQDDVTADPKVEPLKEGEKAVAEQRPRYRDLSFGSHATMFDLRRAAGYEPGGLLNPDFTPYRVSGTVGRAVGEKTGFGFVVGYNANRSGSDPMMGGERASMQVRNGSGGGQTYLSTASAVFLADKVIRANKGERFDTGAENQATVVLDLSIAKEMGVDIVNQHSEDSHRFKIAYDRLVEEDDLKGLQRQVVYRLMALQKDLGRIGGLIASLGIQKLTADAAKDLPLVQFAAAFAKRGLRPSDIGIDMKDYQYLLGRWDIVEQIMALVDTKSIDRRRLIKRSAEEELDEYIYSARKNREVLMSRIPIECVIWIRLNPEPKKWPNLDSQRFPGLAAAQRESRDEKNVTRGFRSFDSVRLELADYFVGSEKEDGNEPYKRTIAMFKLAAQQKQAETTRT
jgi:hypothetical protein